MDAVDSLEPLVMLVKFLPKHSGTFRRQTPGHPLANQFLHFVIFSVMPRLHDTAGCQTGCTTGMTTAVTTGCIV